MRDIVLERVPAGRALQVLDIGCGTGGLAFRLADALSDGTVTGVDISLENIRAAEAQQREAPRGDRLRFIRVDYLEYQTAPVDLIVTDGAIHFVRARAVDLWAKIARDLRPGGVVVCAMAYDCLHNRVLAVARRTIRALRGPAFDAILMTLGRMVYGRTLDDALIRERIEYMYIPPEQFMSKAVTASAPSMGLRLIARDKLPGVSVTQLQQQVIVFEKASDG